MPEAGGLFYSGHIAGDQPLVSPVILLHGAGGSRLDWMLRKIPGRDVIAIDLPGHGALIGQPGRSSVVDYALAIIAFLDALHITRAAFVGHSMGGAIALSLALEQSKRVAGLVLISTGARLRVHPAVIDNILHSPEISIRQVVDWSWSSHAPPETRDQMAKQLLLIPSQTLHGDFTACNAFDVSERLTAINAPTLILVGAEDQMTPIKYSTFLSSRIDGAQLNIIPNAGHMVTLEQPEAVNTQITSWFDRVMTDVASSS